MNLYKNILMGSIGIFFLLFSFPVFSTIDFEKMDKVDVADIIFKRVLVGAIDTTQKINSALGVENLDGIEKIVVIPGWFLAAQAVARVTNGLLDDVNRLTPEKRMQIEEFSKDTTHLVDAEYRVAQVNSELEQLKAQIINEQNNDPDVKFAREQLSQLDSEEARNELKKAMDRVQEPHLESLKELEKRLSDLNKSKNNLLTKFTSSLRSFRKTGLVYWTGRFIRITASITIFLGFLAVEVLILGDAVVIVFDKYEDMDLVKQSLIEDIQKTIEKTFKL